MATEGSHPKLNINGKENSVVHISEEAEKVLKDYFEGKEITPIRVFLHAGG
jgi:hypothetical protein